MKYLIISCGNNKDTNIKILWAKLEITTENKIPFLEHRFFLTNPTHFLRVNHSETKLATLTHDILASKKLSHLVSYNTKRFPECNYDLGLGANDSGIMLWVSNAELNGVKPLRVKWASARFLELTPNLSFHSPPAKGFVDSSYIWPILCRMYKHRYPSVHTDYSDLDFASNMASLSVLEKKKRDAFGKDFESTATSAPQYKVAKTLQGDPSWTSSRARTCFRQDITLWSCHPQYNPGLHGMPGGYPCLKNGKLRETLEDPL